MLQIFITLLFFLARSDETIIDNVEFPEPPFAYYSEDPDDHFPKSRPFDGEVLEDSLQDPPVYVEEPVYIEVENPVYVEVENPVYVEVENPVYVEVENPVFVEVENPVYVEIAEPVSVAVGIDETVYEELVNVDEELVNVDEELVNVNEELVYVDEELVNVVIDIPVDEIIEDVFVDEIIEVSVDPTDDELVLIEEFTDVPVVLESVSDHVLTVLPESENVENYEDAALGKISFEEETADHTHISPELDSNTVVVAQTKGADILLSGSTLGNSGCGINRDCLSCKGLEAQGCYWSGESGCFQLPRHTHLEFTCSGIVEIGEIKATCSGYLDCNSCTAQSGCVFYKGQCKYSIGPYCRRDFRNCVNAPEDCPVIAIPIDRFSPQRSGHFHGYPGHSYDIQPFHHQHKRISLPQSPYPTNLPFTPIFSRSHFYPIFQFSNPAISQVPTSQYHVNRQPSSGSWYNPRSKHQNYKTKLPVSSEVHQFPGFSEHVELELPVSVENVESATEVRSRSGRQGVSGLKYSAGGIVRNSIEQHIKENSYPRKFEQRQSQPLRKFEQHQSQPLRKFEQRQSQPLRKFEQRQSQPLRKFEQHQSQPLRKFEQLQSQPVEKFKRTFKQSQSQPQHEHRQSQPPQEFEHRQFQPPRESQPRPESQQDLRARASQIDSGHNPLLFRHFRRHTDPQ